MIEVAQPVEKYSNEEAMASVVDEVEEAGKTIVSCDEPQHTEDASTSPTIDPSNTESSSRSSAVRDSPRIQLSPGSPCNSSFSLPPSSRRSMSPNSENEGGLKLPQSVDGISSGLSPTSTTSSGVASSTQGQVDMTSGVGGVSRKLSQTTAEKRHVCDVCGKAFPYVSILESHKRCHTGERPFSCHYCSKSFSQKATLQVHTRTHTGERPYQCKFCPKTFAQYGTKTVHEKSSHLGVRNYKCPICSKCLSSPSALYTHKKTHGEKVFACPQCPKTFTLKNYLKLHVRQVHQQNDRRHVCSFCDKAFSYAGSLQVHLRTHTGERPYICRFCPKSFASQGNLQSHERTHTNERPYSCGICNRSFIQKSQLTSHEATHMSSDSSSGDSNVPLSADSIHAQLSSLQNSSPPALQDPSHQQAKSNDYQCRFCGKRYSYASSLHVHIRQHTGERPFNCDHCNKQFTSQGNLIVHMRMHTGEKPFACSGCNKCYTQKVGLKIHQEQCQTYLNRRGSVVTVGTNDSDSSPSLVEDDYIVVDEDINTPVKPQPIHLAGRSNRQLFSTPTNSQRESFSSDMFFTPLVSPTAIGQQQSAFPPLSLELDQLTRLLKFPAVNGNQPTSSSLDTLTRQNEMLFNSTAPASSVPTNNNYKDSLNNLLMEQQLLQNLQKLQQLFQSPPAPTTPLQSPTNLLNGLFNLPPPVPQTSAQQSIDLLSQLQLLQSVQQPQPITSTLSNSLTASLAAALDNLTRQQNNQPPQMFIGN